jgi:hypothetical protein
MAVVNIEALWVARFGDATAPDTMRNGGVVVFETGRLFGGDSAYAYVGSYSISGGSVSGAFEIIRHNADPQFVDVWLTGDAKVSLTFVGQIIDGNTISAVLSRDGVTVGCDLHRLAELPG